MVGYHRYLGHELSRRERDVVELMAKGLTNGEIAERLNISFATAKNHVSAVISKFGVESREEAVQLWREERRIGARFSRAMRGLVAGVGLGKVAAGMGGVVAVGLAAAIGMVTLGGQEPEATHAEASGAPTLFHVMTVQSGERQISLSIQRWGDVFAHYVFDEAEPPDGVGALAPTDSERWLNETMVERFGVLYGWFSEDSDTQRSVELVFEGMAPIEVPAVRAPRETGTSLSFWMVSVEGMPQLEAVLILDPNNGTVFTTNPDSAWHQRRASELQGEPQTPTPAP